MSNREQYIKYLRERIINLEFHDFECSGTQLLVKRLEGISDKEYNEKYHEFAKITVAQTEKSIARYNSKLNEL